MKNILIIFFLLSTSSLTYSQKTNEAQIVGTIINGTEGTIQIGENTVPISEKGEFSYKIKTDFPTFYAVNYKYSNWTIYVEPGKTTEFKITTGDKSSLDFMGDLKSSNNYLKKFDFLNNSIFENIWIGIHIQGESGFISSMDSLKGLYINPLIRLSKNDKSISSVFIKLIERDIDYKFNSLILRYPKRHFDFTKEKTSLSQAVFENLNSETIDNIQYLNLPNYKWFCLALIDYRADILINASTESNHYSLKKMDAVFQLIPTMFKNQTLSDFFLTEYLYQHIENNGLANSKKYIEEFNSRCKTRIYKTRINDLCTSITDGEKDHLVKTYKTANGFILQAHIFYPENMVKGEKRPAIAIFHGGGWITGTASGAFGRAKHFANQGIVGVAVQYRLSNFEDVTPVEAVKDSRDVIIWLRTYADSLGINPDKIAGEGWSSGGHLITCAAFFPETSSDKEISSAPNVIILKSPAVEAESWCIQLLGTKDIDPKTISPLDNIKEGMSLPPILILQGRTDGVTPTERAQLFYDRMKAANHQCELVIFEDCGHLFTPSYLDDTNGVSPDKEISKKADEKADEFLRKLGYIE